MEAKIFVVGALFLLKIATGLWLMKNGKPYSTFLLNIHKLIALTTLVLIVNVAWPFLKNGDARELVLQALFATGGFFLAAIVTGGFLSAKKEAGAAAVVHKIASVVTLLCAAFSIYSLVVL